MACGSKAAGSEASELIPLRAGSSQGWEAQVVAVSQSVGPGTQDTRVDFQQGALSSRQSWAGGPESPGKERQQGWGLTLPAEAARACIF